MIAAAVRAQTRTLFALAVMGLAGIAALAWLGQQYRKVLVNARPGSAPPRAVVGPVGSDGAVGAFVHVRRALKGTLDADPAGAAALLAAVERGDGIGGSPAGALQGRSLGARDEALRRTGLALGDYRGLVRAYRAWRERGSTGDPGLDAAFDARRAELEAADLGPYERLDD